MRRFGILFTLLFGRFSCGVFCRNYNYEIIIIISWLSRHKRCLLGLQPEALETRRRRGKTRITPVITTRRRSESRGIFYKRWITEDYDPSGRKLREAHPVEMREEAHARECNRCRRHEHMSHICIGTHAHFRASGEWLMFGLCVWCWLIRSRLYTYPGLRTATALYKSIFCSEGRRWSGRA